MVATSLLVTFNGVGRAATGAARGCPDTYGQGVAVSSARIRVVTAAGISLAVAIGVAGCGTAQQISAKDAVTNGLTSLGDAHNVALTVTLDTTVADVAAISKAQGDPMSASEQKTFALVLKGDIVYDVQAAGGKTFAQAAKAQKNVAQPKSVTDLFGDPAALSAALKRENPFSISAHLSGNSLFDFRMVDGVLYLRADVKKILTLAGQDPAQLNSALSQLPPSMSGIAVAAKGKWVSVDLVKAAAAVNGKGLLKSLPTTPVPSSAATTADLQKLLADLKVAYSEKATITSLGNSSRGAGYRLSAPAKQIAQAVSADLVAMLGKTTGPQIEKEIGKIPDKSFSLDVWVKDDKLSDVSVDLTQFIDKVPAGKKLAINIVVDAGGGAVSAPSGATAIDVKSLLSLIPTSALSGLASSSGSSTGSGSSSSSSSSSGGAVSSGTTTSGTTTSGGSDSVFPGLTKEQIQRMKDAGLSAKQIKQLEGAAKN